MTAPPAGGEHGTASRIEILPLTGVPTRHLDLQFVAYAPPAAQIAISDESVDLRWWPIDGLPPGSDGALAFLVARAARV